MSNPSEKRFETHIEQSLNQQGYKSIHFNEYDRTLCIVPNEIISFLKHTQPKEWEKLELQYGSDTENKFLKRLSDEIGKRGVIDVLRNGIKDRGSNFSLVYFEPKSGLNKEHQELYKQNQLVVVRQLHYSLKNENSIDMVLFINGIPIVTMELKNELTGQNYKHSENQYKRDRDPNEPLLKFKRCIVHFCVDNDRVTMTTELRGEKTFFLPYNKGIDNPTNPSGYKTHYLWEEVLSPTSILDILENFVHLSEEKEKEWDSQKGKVIEKTKYLLIFPRYHQLDVIRKLKSKIIEEGTGFNYLIQHTTGSGKSYSIGWLSHLLTSLYRTKDDTRRIFDTIIVVTDRKVLDKQLQGTIKQLEQTSGVVSEVKEGSQQLKEYLEKGKDIIITTIQKFPYISEQISQLGSRTFGVIIDEVHSSQSGETSKHLKKTISEHQDLDGDGDIDYEDMIREEIRSRGKQKHISFFGFTGTPKNKTLELFGRKDENGNFVSFHSYSMKQSIFEGFTLDVLQNYTTYKRWFKLIQKDEEDKQLPEGKVKKELVNFVDSHSETISQKVRIILEHFTNKTSKTIGGRGRGMVVVRSRYHCVLFQQEMKKQMIEMGLPYSCLVGYSGSINYHQREVTEDNLNQENGLGKGVSIPEGLKDPRYRILIVSNKFQTGFDEPLIHSMFIDKKLNGVQCVQTLSRLNRTTSGKTDTFVLDFVNDTEDIVESFQPFYTSTIIVGETDPNKLYDIETKINSFNLFTKYEVDEFNKLFYDERETDEGLQPILNRVISKWKEIEDIEKREEFKSNIQSYIRLYGYISQIISFEDIELEKLFIFLKYVNKKLPKEDSTRIQITDSIDLDSLRIQKIGEHKLSLEDKIGEVQPFSPESGGNQVEEPIDFLSEIIQKINKIHGVDLSEEHKVNLKRVTKQVYGSDDLQKVMEGDNSELNKKKKVEEILKMMLLGYVNDQFDFYKRMENPQLINLITNELYKNYPNRSLY
jgi:type I restriction enzyme, R subunit